jgi:hypothetical protein
MEYCFNWMVRSNWVPYHRFTDEADVATFLASPIGIMATGHHVFDPRNPFYAPPERVLHFGGEPFGAVRDSWFPREYLGDVIYGRFVATAPILVAIDDVGGLLYNALALYLEDSNCLFMVGEARTEADKRHKMAHELHHLCSRLGGGSRGIRWINEHGEPMVMTQVTWFNEGVTEILAQQMTREHGYEPTFVGYSYEPIVAFYLQQLVGLETLKIAYFTGDFTEVRRIVNQRVGEGTFEQILQLEGSPRVASSAALEFLVGRLNAAGIFYSEWERNSIITQARSELTED